MDLRKRLRQCNLDVLFNLLPDKIINNNSSEILYFFINYENKKLGYALTDNAMQNDDANEYITNFNPNNIAESLINVIMLCCKNHQISEKAKKNIIIYNNSSRNNEYWLFDFCVFNFRYFMGSAF